MMQGVLKINYFTETSVVKGVIGIDPQKEV
jgi:hypothetical protein